LRILVRNSDCLAIFKANQYFKMKTSFIVDGDVDFLFSAERQISLMGYRVYLFSDVDKFISSIKLGPQLIILGDRLTHTGVDYIRKTRKYFPKSIIIHVAQPGKPNIDVAAIKAGASEFIEKDSATFVRLRTTLDFMEKQNQLKSSSFFSKLKKVFAG